MYVYAISMYTTYLIVELFSACETVLYATNKSTETINHLQ